MRPPVPIRLRRELPRRGESARSRPGAPRARRRAASACPRAGVLSIKPFRRLWIALSLSSLGDWLSLVALTVLAPSLAAGGRGQGLGRQRRVAGHAAAGPAVRPAGRRGGGPAGPPDGHDRRRRDPRPAVPVHPSLFPNLTWILVAKFLAGVASLFWNPAKAASIPNLVPKDKLERANQFSLLTTYGTAPLAAGLFSVLALVSEGISRVTPLFHASNVDLALYFNAASFLVSALTVYFLREIPKRQASGRSPCPPLQVHLGGLAVHRAGPRWCAAWSSAWWARSPRPAWWSAWATPTSSTRCTAAARAGAWSSPRSSSAWRSAWSSAPACSATSAAAGCSA